MKTIYLVISLLFAGCSGSTETKTEPDAFLLSNTNASSNAAAVNLKTFERIPYEFEKIDQSKMREINEKNEKFRQIPDEFKNVDFKNFKYPIVRLKNSEYEKFGRKNSVSGGENFSLLDVFFINLDDDPKKEAVVLLGRVICGGSCDGGSINVYFYAAGENKPHLLGEIATGSTAYGCSLKSFKIENKTISLEQFRRCSEKSDSNADKDYVCKFCVKDRTFSKYMFEKNKLKRNESFEESSPQTSVKNYYPLEIILSE